MIIKVLPAFYGDCTIVSWENNGVKRNILIDGGPPRTYHRHLKPELLQILQSGEQVDLLIVTHVDEDHIGGIKKLYEDVGFDKSCIKKVWFNCGNCISNYIEGVDAIDREIKLIMSNQTDMSFNQGNTLERSLLGSGWEHSIIVSPDTLPLEEATLQILSPTYDQLVTINNDWQTEEGLVTDMSGKVTDHHEEITDLLARPFKHDRSVVNGSCISFLIEVEGKTFLLLADAFPTVVEASLRELGYNEENKLSVDVVRVAHHGSKFNNNDSLYSIIESKKFIVSTDGNRDHMPHKEALARVIHSNPGSTFFFNYTQPSEIFSSAEKISYDFNTVDLSTQHYTIVI